MGAVRSIHHSYYQGMTAQGGARIAWVDVGRAIAVLAVLLMHYRIWGIAAQDNPTGGGLRQWRMISTAFDGIRMPLLFVLSGALASRTLLARPPRAGMRRAVSSFYLVLIWTTIYALLGALNLAELAPVPGSWQGYLRVLFVPSTTMWFVYALGAYTVVIICLRRAPAWFVLALFMAATAFAHYFGDQWPLLTWRTVAYGVFFAVGVYGRDALFRFAARPQPLMIAVALVLYTGSLVGRSALSALPTLELLGFLVRSGTGIVLGITLAVLLARFIPALALIGRRTLPIYVLHVPLIWLILSMPALQTVFFPPSAKWAWPLIGVTFIVAVSLALHAILMRTPARVLFDMPRSWLRVSPDAPRSADTVPVAADSTPAIPSAPEPRH